MSDTISAILTFVAFLILPWFVAYGIATAIGGIAGSCIGYGLAGIWTICVILAFIS
jgi:hypothetical protein